MSVRHHHSGQNRDEYTNQRNQTFITNAIIADVFVVFAYTDRSAGSKA